jgi:hypothetical protein
MALICRCESAPDPKALSHAFGHDHLPGWGTEEDLEAGAIGILFMVANALPFAPQFSGKYLTIKTELSPGLTWGRRGAAKVIATVGPSFFIPSSPMMKDGGLGRRQIVHVKSSFLREANWHKSNCNKN